MRRGTLAACLVVALVAGLSGTSGALLIPYVAPTGQTATADFSFSSPTALQIILTETTPADAFDPADDPANAILTTIGFRLPNSAVIVLPGTVVIAPGSGSVGFQVPGSDPKDYGPGTDVSGEWGATIEGEQPMDSVGEFDFVTANKGSQVDRFSGLNRDGPLSIDGPEAGLLDDSASVGGLGVIDRAVVITLTLDADPDTLENQGLTDAEQTTFLASLWTDSIVEYGSDSEWGRPIPEPGTLLLLGSGLAGLMGYSRFRRKKE